MATMSLNSCLFRFISLSRCYF